VTLEAVTPLGFGLIDFDSDAWHEDEHYNWKLVDALLNAGSGGAIPFAVAGGTANAITVDYVPDIVLINGVKITFRAIATILAGAATVNVDGTGAKPLKFLNNDPIGKEIVTGDIVTAIYSSTDNAYHVLSPIRRVGRLTIVTGTIGGTPSSGADAIVIHGGMTPTGITIMNQSPAFGSIAFGDSGNAQAGLIRYSHSGDVMDFFAGGNLIFSIDDTAGLKLAMSGTDLAFKEENNNIIRIGPDGDALSGIFINVANNRIGINEPSPQVDFSVKGLSRAGGVGGGFIIGKRTTGNDFVLYAEGDVLRFNYGGSDVATVGADGKFVSINSGTFITQNAVAGLILRGRASDGDNYIDFRTNNGAGLYATLIVDSATGEFTFSDRVFAEAFIPSTDIAIADGGTGASSAAAALTNLGGLGVAYKGMPQRVVSSSGQDILATDKGGHILYTGGAGSLTIRDQVDIAYEADHVTLIINDGSGVLTITRDTNPALIWAASGANANRNLAVGGMAFIIRTASDRWFINGTGLS
jgi:hypothetical protein